MERVLIMDEKHIKARKKAKAWRDSHKEKIAEYDKRYREYCKARDRKRTYKKI